MDLLLEPLRNYGLLGILIYLVIKEIFPKVWPDYVKTISKRVSNEDRLFKLFEDNAASTVKLAETMIKLQNSIDGLAMTLVALDQRVDRLEHTFSDSEMSLFIRWFKSLPVYSELQRTSILEVRQAHG